MAVAQAAAQTMPTWQSIPDRSGTDVSLVALVARAMATEAVSNSKDLAEIRDRGDAIVDTLQDAGHAELATALDSLLGELEHYVTQLAALIGAETARHFDPADVWRQIASTTAPQDWYVPR